MSAAPASVWPAQTDDAVGDESLDHVERLRQLRREGHHRDAGLRESSPAASASDGGRR